MAEPKSGVESKLDILISLQAAALVERFGTQREKIAFLGRAGLSASLIAQILNTTPNTVSVALSKMRAASRTSSARVGGDDVD